MIWAVVVALLALTPPPAEVTLTGRVVRVVGGDTVAVGGARLVLHRVMAARQGPIDSALSGANGSFRFHFRPDSGAIFLISARWAGIEYFAPPITIPAGAAPDPVLVTVADTSSNAPVELAARDVVVSAPEADGTRTVLELMVLENRGPRTRIGRDSTAATWMMVLPSGVARVELGDTDFAADAIEVRGDTLRIRAPLPPGQRQLTVQYQLPAGVRRWVIPVGEPVAAMHVLLEEPTAAVTGALARADSQVVDGKRFSRWEGAVPRAASVGVVFDVTGVPPWVLPALVTLLGAGLVAALVVARHRGRASPAAAAPRTRSTALPPDAELLLERIAALDATHADGPTLHAPEAWQGYLRERAQLKRELEHHLPL